MKKLGRNDICWCGSGNKYKTCHMQFDEKIRKFADEGYYVPQHDLIKTREQIEGIRESGKVNIAILDYVAENIGANVSTEDINRWVEEKTKELGGIAAPLGFDGYPKSVCTSINEVVCHGIPSKEEILKEGDIINVDVSTLYHGYYSDSSRMFCIGNVSKDAKKLVDDVKKCVEIGLKHTKPWTTLGDLGSAIHEYAKSLGYSVVREIGGHGIGLEFHEEPYVSYVAKAGEEMMLVPGMCFTIEPMVNQGKSDIYIDEDNGWTVFTEDGKLSAQWEVQVVVTEEGYDIVAY
ncbi:MAG: methionyl aminopeptidase [Lachnospiraceae bacterium]|nr:methionyl aminopeptidase [Lachnospiraceae bacterium]